jgi:hypothetical protein
MLQPSRWVALLEIKLLTQDSFTAWLNSLAKSRNDTRCKCQTDNVKWPIPNRNSINPLYRAPSTNATGARVSTKHRAVVWFSIVPRCWRDFALRDIEHERSKNLETTHIPNVKKTMPKDRFQIEIQSTQSTGLQAQMQLVQEWAPSTGRRCGSW